MALPTVSPVRDHLHSHPQLPELSSIGQSNYMIKHLCCIALHTIYTSKRWPVAQITEKGWTTSCSLCTTTGLLIFPTKFFFP